MPVDKLSRMDAANMPDQQAGWDDAVKRAQGETGAEGEGQVFKPVIFAANDANWRDQANNVLDKGAGSDKGAWKDLFPDLTGAERDKAIREANRSITAVNELNDEFKSRNDVDGFSFTDDGLVFYKEGKVVDVPNLTDDQKLMFKWLANNDGLVKELGGGDGIALQMEIAPWLDSKVEGIKSAGKEYKAWVEQNPGASHEQRVEKRLELIGKAGEGLVPQDSVNPALSPTAPEKSGPALEKWLKAHGKDADPMSKEVAGNADYLIGHWDQITNGKNELTLDDLKAYISAHPELSQDAKDALNFWSHPGMFDQIDSGGDNPAMGKDDGIVLKGNIESWLDIEAPTNASQFSNLLNDAALQSLGNKVDISNIGPDIFANPNNYTKEQRAAVLVELMNARTMIHAGIQSGVWSDYASQLRVEHVAKVNPDSDKVIADLDDKINKLMDSEGIQDYMRDATGTEIKNILDGDPGLKSSTQNYFDTHIKNGSEFKNINEIKDSKGNAVGIPAALEAFINQAETLSKGLGLAPPDLRAMITESGQMPAVEQYFKDKIVTGSDFSDMIAKGIDPNIAMMSFGDEIAKFSQVLDPALVESTRDETTRKFGEIANDALLNGVKFEDIKAAYGKEDGTLDEDKIRELFTTMAEQNPELFVGPNGTKITPDQVVAMFRQAFDAIRQGAKVTDAFKKLDFIKDLPTNFVQSAYGKGITHLLSGTIMGGVTIARGIKYGNGAKTPADIAGIVTGSTITAGLMIEGGAKAYNTWLNDVGAQLEAEGRLGPKPGPDTPATEQRNAYEDWRNSKAQWASKVENAGKILGGSSNIVMGIFSIISGAADIKKGNTVVGGVNIAGGGLTLIAGGVSAAEGIMNFFGLGTRLVLSSMGMVAGVAGGIATLFGLGAMIGLQYWADKQQEKMFDKFARNLDDFLGQWHITGGPTQDGDFTHEDDYINWGAENP
ncbi:type III effector HrpK domain-containing protein [Novosphingobium kaempferiae]|uniref:type III effector HrpK domain-containing protein n=1 Tax=Novosphingobium kaempferiae TaxID=2896849 RepID=UPI001E4C3E41|nr:type III effector HrpK domain-containing protein [Novosphingobium kaempferiae]